MVLPSPTLHLDPLAIRFLERKMFFQAKELDEDAASKIEQFGKYLALKTL